MRLALEAREQARLACEIVVDDLDREARVDPQMRGLVQPRHAALPEHTYDSVRVTEHDANLWITRLCDFALRRRIERTDRELCRIAAPARGTFPRDRRSDVSGRGHRIAD